MMMTCVCVFKVYPPVNLNPWISWMLLRSWPTKHPWYWQSYVFCSKLHNYIIAIGEEVAIWLWLWRAVFWGNVHWSLEGWPLRWFFLIINTWWFFCWWQTLFFGQKWNEELVGQAGGQTGGQMPLHWQLRYFFPRCQKRLQLLCSP